MLRQCTHTALVAVTLLGLCHSTPADRSARADEYCDSCDSTALDGYGAEAYLSDMAGAGGDARLLARLQGCRMQNGVLTCNPWEYGNPDLFYNFYVPNNCGSVPAQLYLAPRPVPPLVGHTYYTYQPFLPHEMTYPHHRTYRQWYDGGRGMTRAKATWYCEPVSTTYKTVRNAIRLPR
jgi:hypothetical protein